jgi:hypothetical protein
MTFLVEPGRGYNSPFYAVVTSMVKESSRKWLLTRLNTNHRCDLDIVVVSVVVIVVVSAAVAVVESQVHIFRDLLVSAIRVPCIDLNNLYSLC